MFFVDAPPVDAGTKDAATQASIVSAILHPHRQRWSAWFVLTLLCAALFFYGLNIGDFQKTEGLRALIGANMLKSGNYVTPMLYEKPLLTKPPVMYAAIALCSLPFGEVTELSARLPSALAGTLVVLLLYWYSARHLGRLGGLTVAAIMPCSFLWLEKGGSAEIDMLQVFWVAAALVFFFRAVETPGSTAFAVLALGCVAGGFLTKWTGPLFFYAAAIPFLWCRGRLRWLWSAPHLAGCLFAATLCSLWVAAVVYQVGWKELIDTVVMEAEPRLSHSEHLESGSALLRETLLHPFKLFATALPFSVAALATLWPGFARLWSERERYLLQAFHCWTWPALLVMTLLPEHATRHSFPLFPGIAGLGAMAWVAFIQGRMTGRGRRLFSFGALTYSCGFGLFLLAGCAAAFRHLPAEVWWIVGIVAAMGLWCVVESVRAWREGRLGGMLAAFVLTWVVLKVTMVQVYVPWRDAERRPKAKAAMLAHTVPADHPLYLINVKDEGLMFYYRRPVVRLRNWSDLPLGRDPAYVIVTRSEYQWMQAQPQWRIEREWPFRDTQDDAITLLEVTRREPPAIYVRLAMGRNR